MTPSDDLSPERTAGLRTMAQDEQTTDRLRMLLSDLLPLRERYDRLRRDGPAPDSQATAADQSEIGRLALAFARLQWIAASDHLLTWAVVIEAQIQPWHGHASLLRQGLDGAATVRWLLDPSLRDDDRRQRGAAIQRRDYEDRLEWERATGTADKSIFGRRMNATERLAELDELLRREKIPLEPRIRGVGKIVDAGWVNDPRFAWMATGRALYQALSSISHNRAWSSLFSERKRVGPASAGIAGSQDVLATANGPLAVVFTACTMATMRAALRDLEAYCGVEMKDE